MAHESDIERSPWSPVQVGRPRRRFSRREFLKVTGAVGGAGVLTAIGINRLFIHERANKQVESAYAELDPHTLKAIFDNTTNTTFVIDPQGNVVRTIESPGIVRNALAKEQGFEAEVSWMSVVGGKLGAPWILIMKTQDGERIEKELDFANRVSIDVDNTPHP